MTILNTFQHVISNGLCCRTGVLEEKDVLALQWKLWQEIGNVLCTSSDVSHNHTSTAVVVLDVILKECLSFSSLLADDPNNLPMGRLLNECQYFLLPWFQCGMLIDWHMLNLWLSMHLQSFLVFIWQWFFWQVLIGVQKFWHCLPHFQLLTILSLGLCHFKHYGFHIRLGSFNGFFLAHSHVTFKIGWPPKHLGAICADQWLFRRDKLCKALHLGVDGFGGFSISLVGCNILNNDGIGTFSRCEWANGDKEGQFLSHQTGFLHVVIGQLPTSSITCSMPGVEYKPQQPCCYMDNLCQRTPSLCKENFTFRNRHSCANRASWLFW